jgi:hypothetical protein
MQSILARALFKAEGKSVLYHVKLLSQELGFLNLKTKKMSTNACKPNLMFSKYDRDRLKCIGKVLSTSLIANLISKPLFLNSIKTLEPIYQVLKLLKHLVGKYCSKK